MNLNYVFNLKVGLFFNCFIHLKTKINKSEVQGTVSYNRIVMILLLRSHRVNCSNFFFILNFCFVV